MLQKIIEALKSHHRPLAMPYHLPGLWVDGKSTAKQTVDPYEFYTRRIEDIMASPAEPIIQPKAGQEWSQRATVYNLFPRVTAAYSHANDGQIRIKPRPDGWRDTGTLLKSIALLPYIKSMGFNTVHLLPITSVGQDGKKGTLGSPYGIRNPYLLDDMLAEPAVGLSAEILFAGFVEAAHHLGLRVVMEFVLRTASKDADWIKDHPDWFYWIRDNVRDRPLGSVDPGTYGLPIFEPHMLNAINGKVAAGDFSKLPPPPAIHRAMFTPPPRKDQVTMEDGRWVGTLDDGTRVRIPGAFSDWPLEGGQPPWSDVTYLRLYDHPDFNYIAYNTLRFYDKRLAQPENVNESLWDAITGIIPYYQTEFGIDGVMLDMGHALPMPLKKRMVESARAIDPDFAFWEENFGISAESRREGYNAVMGYLVFDLHKPEGLRYFIKRWSQEEVPIPFFATPENHNTPRAASRNGNSFIYSYYTLPLCMAMPGIPFVHSGFELGERQPVNTGLDFNGADLSKYPPEKLPLFSAWAYNWECEANLVEGVRYALALRQQYEDLLTDTSPDSWHIGSADNPHLAVFSRCKNGQTLSFVANTDLYHHQGGRVLIAGNKFKVQGVWGTPDLLPVHHGISLDVDLSPGYVLVLEGDKLPLNGC